METAQSPVRRTSIRRHMSSRTRRKTAAFYAFIAPWLTGFVVLGIIPLVLGFLTSLTDYDGLNLPTVKLVGLSNYARAFSDPDVRFSLGRTLAWALLNLPIWLVLSFALALVLNQKVKGRGVFRTLFYLPSIVPAVTAVWVWKMFLDTNYGLLNAILSLFRPGTALPWLSTYALQGLTAVAVWGGLGSGLVIFLAGLQGIPDELIEAARVDGANSWHIFRHVTIPLMTPLIFFQLIMALIGSFQQFVIPLLLTTTAGSGSTGLPPVPPRPVYLYMNHVYRQIFRVQRFGYGTALLWLLCVAIIALTALVFRTERYWVYSEMATEQEAR
jgi:multiple sugar transport system permease protein